jgi:hypothetical protein
MHSGIGSTGTQQACFLASQLLDRLFEDPLNRTVATRLGLPPGKVSSIVSQK